MLELTLPFSGVEMSLLLLLGLGAAVGLLGGFFGVGGGWIITPALNIFGMPIPYAVGTGFGYIMGMSFISAVKHHKHGNLDLKLALTIGISMMFGVLLGKKIMLILDASGQAGPVVRIFYILLLFFLGLFMLFHTLLTTRGADIEKNKRTPGKTWFQSISLKPVLFLASSHIYVSIWPLIGTGLIIGFLAGMMGVGGGFLLVPVMIYLVGIPTGIAVGTSLLCLLLFSPFGVLAYSGIFAFVDEMVQKMGLGAFLLKGGSVADLARIVKASGHVEFLAAAIMVAGAAIGAPLGVACGRIVKGQKLRLLYALMMLLGGVSVLLRQFNLVYLARVVILGAPLAIVILILVLTLYFKHQTKNA